MTTPAGDTAKMPDADKVISWHRSIRSPVFYVAAGIILAISILGAVFADVAESVVISVRNSTVEIFGWFYTLSVAGFVIFCAAVAISRMGHVRFGGPKAKPEYSRWTWLAMLFSAGMGVGMVFWGTAAPITFYNDPPPMAQAEAGTVEAARYSMHMTYVHWGVHAWAIYAVMGMAIAYAVHSRKRSMSIRWILEPIFGKRIEGWIGDVIDITAIVSAMFGVAVSLGFGVLQLNSGMGLLGYAEEGLPLQLMLIAAITLIATISVATGIGRGIKYLSHFNIVLATGLVVFILVAGPTLFLLNQWVDGFGFYLTNVVETTFSTGSFYGNEWEALWTFFYWGSWVAWAPLVGVFIARISKGRTVREFVLGVLIVPFLASTVWFSVLGGSVIFMQQEGQTSFIGLPVEETLFALLDNLPAAQIVSSLVLLLVITFFVTSSDSASLVIDILASRGRLNTPVATRVFWAVLEGVVAAMLLIAGGLDTLQAATVIFGLPFALIMVLSMYATFKVLRADPQAKLEHKHLHASVPQQSSGEVGPTPEENPAGASSGRPSDP